MGWHFRKNKTQMRLEMEKICHLVMTKKFVPKNTPRKVYPKENDGQVWKEYLNAK